MDDLIFLYVKHDKDRAFNIVYKRYYKKIYGLAYKILYDKTIVEDCVQEIFIKVYENLEKFRFGSSLGTWIYRITINHLINVNKKIDFYLDIDEERFQSKVEYSIELTELQEKLKKALNGLNELEKKVFILREMEGFSYKEIANITELNEGTVKSKLHYIKLKLRDILSEYVNNQ